MTFVFLRVFEGVGVWEMMLRVRFSFAWVQEGNHDSWVSCLAAEDLKEEIEGAKEGAVKQNLKTLDWLSSLTTFLPSTACPSYVIMS